MRSVLLLLDFVMVSATAFAAVMLRDNPDLWAERFQDLTPYLVFSMLAAAMVLPLSGTSRSLWHYSSFNDFLRIMIAALVLALAATTATFAYNRLEGLARAIPLLHVLLIVTFMSALRVGSRLAHRLRMRPQIAPAHDVAHSQENVLLVGDNTVAELFLRASHEFCRDTLRVAGVLATGDRLRGRRLHGAPILGQPEDLSNILRRLKIHGVEVDRIVVALLPSELSPASGDALREVEDGTGIIVDYFTERLGFTKLPRPAFAPSETDAGRVPSLHELALCPRLARPYWAAKRLFDFTVALAALLVAGPVMLVVAVVVALDVGAPVLFWQERPGRFGHHLRLYKFRTMRSAHDARGMRLDDAQRLSRIGAFLRKTRLDELPQLYHILLGEMSFVGPRPLVASEQDAAHGARLAVRPGLTGWAQVQGGRTVSVTDKLALDLWYIRNASFALDFLIALKTLRMVVRGERTDQSAIALAWRDAEDWKIQLRAQRQQDAFAPSDALQTAI